MKPLILARALKKYSFEEERIRKNIKSSLEAVNVKYTKNIFDDFDLIHFINWKSSKEIIEAKQTKKPVILSAFYSELDKGSAYVEYKNNEKIKNKYLQIFETVDLVLVPTITYKKYLNSICPSANVLVYPYPLKEEIFKLDDKEKKLMFRYYTERENSIIILCIGDYLNKTDLENLNDIASLCKKYKFYFLGSNYSTLIKKKLKKKMPKNVVLDTISDPDVYKSLLYNSKLVINLNVIKFENLISYNSMYLKKPIITVKSKKSINTFDQYSLSVDGAFNTSILIEKCLNNKVKTNVNSAYNYIKKYNLVNSGKTLKDIYTKLIK